MSPRGWANELAAFEIVAERVEAALCAETGLSQLLPFPRYAKDAYEKIATSVEVAVTTEKLVADQRARAAEFFVIQSRRLAPALLKSFLNDQDAVAKLSKALDRSRRKPENAVRPVDAVDQAEMYFRQMLRACGVSARQTNNALKHRLK